MRAVRFVALLVLAAVAPTNARADAYVRLFAADNWGADGDQGEKNCPPHRHGRTTDEVWHDRLAALAVGDIDSAMCDYSRDAVVVMPGTVLRGRDQIRAGFLQFYTLFGGLLPQVLTTTIADEIILSTWSIQTPQVSVPDGADTFVVEHGLIQYQTVHVVFGPPAG